MKIIKTAALSGATLLVIASTAAYGQAARTWVSGVGDDVNPCSRTAPCKTFAGAISKTSAGGEINCLDPGGYGGVTITKSITIDCEDTQGSILASGINGVSVNDSASGFPNTINVVLRGISINGSSTGAQNASGNPGSGLVGVNFTSGASLVLEQVIIQDFNAGTATGVRIATGGSTRTYINNSTIINNGLGATGGGIQVTPTGVGGTARVVVTNSRIEDNTNNGFRVDTTGNTNVGGVNVDDRQYVDQRQRERRRRQRPRGHDDDQRHAAKCRGVEQHRHRPARQRRHRADPRRQHRDHRQRHRRLGRRRRHHQHLRHQPPEREHGRRRPLHAAGDRRAMN